MNKIKIVPEEKKRNASFASKTDPRQRLQFWTAVVFALFVTTILSCAAATVYHWSTSDKTPIPPTSTAFSGALPQTFVAAEMEFCLIPEGRFVMGSPETEKLRAVDETQREVTISQPFYMGKYETTVGDFRKFVQATGYQTTAEKEGDAQGFDATGRWNDVAGLHWDNPGFEQTDRNPVTCVDYEDATKYVEWLNRRGEIKIGESNYRFALPTEAQWEYACRAGTQTAFFWGDDPADGQGFFNARGFMQRDGFPFTIGYARETAPVGSFKPNAWGLFDIVGNVWEWTQDWYDANYYQTSPAVDPPGPESGARRVFRGGAWNSVVRDCRSARRDCKLPSERIFSVGIRLVLVRQ